MDILLGKLTSQAMNYAIRSGITITTTYAINQCNRLLKQTPKTDHRRQELLELQLRLESKIRILSPAIDMIELISARGNTMLESAVSLTKGIRFDIQRLGTKVASVVEREGSPDEIQLMTIILSIKALLGQLEDAIPLINLAITTSGVNLTTKLSGTISPSRLLQASTFLIAADTNYTVATQAGSPVRQQVGPIWTLTLYMLFAGHANRALDERSIRETTWKEVIHKARVKLVRIPLDQLYTLPGEEKQSYRNSDMMEGEEINNEFAYQLLIVEDLDDGRVHTYDDSEARPSSFDGIQSAGTRDIVPIHEISKIFYADTGKILNIGSDDDVSNPVLLIKRDVHAEAPRRMLQREQMSPCRFSTGLDESGVDEDGEQSEINAQILRESTPLLSSGDSAGTSQGRLPVDLDPEWMAFEVHIENVESESEDEDISVPTQPSHNQRHNSNHDSPSQGPSNAMSNLNLHPPLPQLDNLLTQSPKRNLPQITTTLSLLEMLLKLASLQQFRQQSHLSISDELLNFFLEDSATAGAGADKHFRRKVRNEAVQRLGFDPYDESPVKRRGEQYIAGNRGAVDVDRAFERGLSEPPEQFYPPSIESQCRACGSPCSISSSPRERDGGTETPSKISTPLRTEVAGEMTRSARLLMPKAASQGSLLATPPSTSKSRLMAVRAKSEPGVGSPLSKEVAGEFEEGDDGEDSSIGS